MPVQAEIAHALPGRIRLRLREKRGDAAYFASLSEEMSNCEGVELVKANAATGSILIEFSGRTEDLAVQLGQHGVSLLPPTASGAEQRPQPFPGNGNATPFHLVSNREINSMFMLGTALAVVGIVQTLRGKILAPSLSVLWYAMEAFRQSSAARASSINADGEFRRH